MIVKDLKIGTKFQTRNNKNIYTVISDVKNIDGIDGIMIKVEDSMVMFMIKKFVLTLE